MALVNDLVLDGGLNYLVPSIIPPGIKAIYICTSEPTTWSHIQNNPGAAGMRIGEKVDPVVSVPGPRVGGGREVTISAITDGSITYTATAAYYALVSAEYTAGSGNILAVGPITTPQAVTLGNIFTLNEFSLGFPAPA